MGWWMTAKPGDRVECVVDYDFAVKLAAITDGITLPRVGQVYTIRNLCVRFDVPCCRLVEIVNDERFHEELGFVDEQAFAVRRFRPLVARPTDISVSKAMLVPQDASRPAAPAPQHEGAES